MKPARYDIPRRIMSLGEVSEVLAAEKTPDSFKPIGRDLQAEFGFSAQALGQFVSWQGFSAADRKLAVALETDDYLFFFDTGNGHTVKIGNQQQIVSRQTGLVTSGERHSEIMIKAGSIGEGFYIPRSMVHRTLAETLDAPVPRSFEFDPTIDLTQSITTGIFGLVSSFQKLCTDPNALVSPLAMSRFEDMLCTLMITNLQHSLTEKISNSNHSVRPATVKRALDYIRAYANTPITTRDIAAAAGVSLRTLQNNFQRFVGMSPLQYLKKVRLEGAHLDLVNASPTADSVVSIAQRWGFVNMGRFAAEYRESYGVYPSGNLARNHAGDDI